MDAKGLDALMPGAFMAKYARPRRFEVRTCVSESCCVSSLHANDGDDNNSSNNSSRFGYV